MQSHARDAGVFIRSMATRGHLGGLARATARRRTRARRCRTDVVIIETVGVGQDEVDIVRTADVSIVTLVPGAGDEVQALKAGIMEIADIFVVNKADREGATSWWPRSRRTCRFSTRRMAAANRRDRRDERAGRTRTGRRDLAISIAAGAARGGEAPASERVAPAGAPGPAVHAEARARRPGAGRVGDVGGSDRRARDRSVHCSGAVVVSRLSLSLRFITKNEGHEGHEDRFGLEYFVAFVFFVLRDEPSGMKAILDHVGIAVSDLDAALRFYRDALGLEVDPSEDVASQRVRAHFIPTGESSLELLEATAPDSPIAKFVGRRGPGLHHITLRVDDSAPRSSS